MNDAASADKLLHKHKTKPQTPQQQADSTTGVNPGRTHGLGVWGNQRVVMSVRVDSELKKQFKSVAKAVYGSTCNPIEAFMATVIGCYETSQPARVYPSLTIGEIRIERSLRERRKLTLAPGLVSEAVDRVQGNVERLKAASVEILRPNYREWSLEKLRFEWSRRQSWDRVGIIGELRRRGVDWKSWGSGIC